MSSQALPVQLPNGTIIRVEATRYGEQKAAAVGDEAIVQPQ